MAITEAPGPLASAATRLVEQNFQRVVVPTYMRGDLTVDEQIHQRCKPLLYLQVASRLVRDFGLKAIVEIGSMREPMRHTLTEFDPVCCNDGHSTLHWAATGAEVDTVDINPSSAVILKCYAREYPNLHAHTGDGIAFLRAFDGDIDFLFLDAWDAIPGSDHAERHLDAYEAALPHLAATCLVQIDDTDVLNGGKGRLLIPHMLRDGFTLITWGRQAILARG